ncbi:hypothetical protein ACLMJK_000026 [Lecanora helva]
MHTSQITLFSLLAITASALPVADYIDEGYLLYNFTHHNNTHHNHTYHDHHHNHTHHNHTSLTPRLGKSGFIVSHANQDCSGTNWPASDEFSGISMGDACHKWSPPHKGAQSSLFVNFGSGGAQFDSIRFFSDDKCKKSNGADDYIHQNKDKGTLCLPQRSAFLSFKADWDPYWSNQKNNFG